MKKEKQSVMRQVGKGVQDQVMIEINISINKKSEKKIRIEVWEQLNKTGPQYNWIINSQISAQVRDD